jgi:hypothetical protein
MQKKTLNIKPHESTAKKHQAAGGAQADFQAKSDLRWGAVHKARMPRPLGVPLSSGGGGDDGGGGGIDRI